MENKMEYEEKIIKNDKIEEKELHVQEQQAQEQQAQEQPGQEHLVKAEYKNAKENLYDHINISVKALDIFIGVAITVLVIILLYVIINSKTFQ